MKIKDIIYHGAEKGDRRAAIILLADGARLNAWYYPGSYALAHVNSLPRDPDDTSNRFSQYHYRKRNLQSAYGRKLAADFKEHAKKHERAAIQAKADEEARKEQERLAAVAEQQRKRASAAADVIMLYDGDISAGNAMGIVSALIDAGYIDRNG